jgi:isocitrate dehydrogenase
VTDQTNLIEYTEEGGITVPPHVAIPFIEGDGTGPDIWHATRLVLEAAVTSAYEGSRSIEWVEILAGEKAHRETGEWLPEETLGQIRKHRVAIKGPLTTPVGEGIRSINVILRQEMDLYACIRPVRYIPGVPSPMKRPQDVDMVVFRENTEDVYAGLEWEAGSAMTKKIIDLVRAADGRTIRADAGIGLKPISRFGTARIVHKAIQYALERGRKSVTIVHKGNIMKYTEGAFRTWAYETARSSFRDRVILEEDHSETGGDIPAGKVLIKDRITDAMFQQILLRPREYDVLAMPNLNGDYMSDALAAMVGGLGMAPGANVGDGYAVFEATHGTAPKYAGQDKVNPGSLIFSGAMMLDYLGWREASDAVRRAVSRTVEKRVVTYDLARQMEGAVEVKGSEFARAVIENMSG